ncbi:hypothetical protein JR338_06825 [Chloroflexota bacterium]|nr:hypothetical protein JR338_06825 [Chloroflexota bacterium]
MTNMNDSDVFTTEILQRDFTQPIHLRLPVRPIHLTWSAFGGPEKAELLVDGPKDELLDLVNLLRCGVTVRDGQGEPVWWGYIEEVQVELEEVEVRVSLEDLANQVSVQYDYTSPATLPGDRNLTDVAEDLRSQVDYGIKTKLLRKTNIDSPHAEALRDTWLEQHARPVSRLTQRKDNGPVQGRLICAGWFKTLGWQPYTQLEGFYANYGPGPGSFTFGRYTSAKYVGQSFTPEINCALKMASFLVRNVGGATRTLTARLHANNDWYPGAVLATSEPFNPVDLVENGYTWANFVFSTPYPLIAGERYWISLDPDGVNSSEYFILRIDESMNFKGGVGRYYNQSTNSWELFPPTDRPDVYFRLVCVTDTSEQLLAIAGSGGQFFPKITAALTGVGASPYRKDGLTCLEEIRKLMVLGTANQRLVLAQVTSNRHLRFYEQPDPDEVDVYMDQFSQFYTREGVPLTRWRPPVGRFARFSGASRINLPWDKKRLPACFIAGAEYWPQTGNLEIRTLDGEGGFG